MESEEEQPQVQSQAQPQLQVKFLYNLSDRIQLPAQDKSKTSKIQEKYIAENNDALDAFIQVESPSEDINHLVLPNVYSAAELLEIACLHAVKLRRCKFGTNNPVLCITKDRSDNKDYIFLNKEKITLNALYVYFVEVIFKLTLSFKDLLDNLNTPNIKPLIYFFSREDVQEYILPNMWRQMHHLKYISKRAPGDVHDGIEKYLKRELTQQLADAILQKHLPSTLLSYWLSFRCCIHGWTKVLDCYHKNLKNYPLRTQTYLPWLILIKKRMKEIEEKYNSLLTNGSLCLRYVNEIIQWLNAPGRHPLMIWLWEFLFNESKEDTKRKILYLNGPTNAGKTFFVMKVLMSGGDWSILERNFEYYAEKGSFVLHALIFDDPGAAKGKNNQVNTSQIMNLSNLRNHKPLSLPAKFGFQSIYHGQIIILSNQLPEALFEAQHIQPMKSRIDLVDFSDYPIKIRTNQTVPSKYYEVALLLSTNTENTEEQQQQKEHHQLKEVKEIPLGVESPKNISKPVAREASQFEDLQNILSGAKGTMAEILNSASQKSLTNCIDYSNQNYLPAKSPNLWKEMEGKNMELEDNNSSLGQIQCSKSPDNINLSEENLPINEEILFYLNWTAILYCLKQNCARQDPINVEINIPNITLRTFALDKNYDSFYDVINKFTDAELMEMVFSDPGEKLAHL